MILLKILGIILAFVGFLILKAFPDMNPYQRAEMVAAGLFVGALFLVVGIALLLLG